ncbi:Solute carrier family 41 member 2 [Schistosoma japonicum]|uniref:Solute carrier family 41 member 2 n=1 Tax=Schistosoma japonicum TaxID=6182 RepID=A0A4Z2DM66_SCHJA|nr:Solute carrier family 41 member 2 [Schistosoma japonicum]TNN17594.1 Solute carrier family 41 member 2 [Schistosoma japonicum]
MFRVQNATLTPWSKSEQSQKCSHCLNTYFTMSSSRHISYVAREIFPACLLAGVGMVVAGCYVDMLQSSGNLTSKGENMFEIIPPILGLKGNLEVALSSRLSTMVHFRKKFSELSSWLFATTLAFILVLAVFASTIIPLMIITLHKSSSVSYFSIDLVHLICISSLTCICATCFISAIVYAIVYTCVFCGANPDNVAPPAAAALGDLVTVWIMSHVNYYFIMRPTLTFAVSICMISVVLMSSIFYLLYHSNISVSGDLRNLTITPSTFKETAVPLTLALTMSSICGNISARFLKDWPIVARLQVPINGVGGIFASMLISRMTTRLHSITCSKNFPLKESFFSPSTTPVVTVENASSDNSIKKCVPIDNLNVPTQSFETTRSCRKLREIRVDVSQVSRLIRFLCVPLHFILIVISVTLSHYFKQDNSSVITPPLLTFDLLIPYLSAGFMQICILLIFAKWIVIKLWKRLHSAKQLDSRGNYVSLASLDFSAIAVTTGLGDLIGTTLFILFLSITKWIINS